jgi:hypothetical protein
VAGFRSERWPASGRNRGRLQIGIPGRLRRNLQRAKRRVSKLWQKLGGDPDDDFIPPRQRGMHRRTYERLIAEAERAEDLAGTSIAASMKKRFGRRLE